MSGGFTKLFESMFDSTVWVGQPPHVKIAWTVIIGKADAQGRITIPVPGLAKIAEITIEQMEEALEIFQRIDPYSRSSESEGRRLVRLTEGPWTGFQLVNHAKYRAERDPEERREQTREAVRRFRDKGQVESCKPNVSHGKPCNQPVSQSKPKKAQAEAEAEAEKTDLCPTRLAGEVEPRIDSPENKNPTFDYKAESRKLAERYPDKQLLRLTWQALSSIRKTGRFADSVVYKHMLTWSRYSVEAVEASCRLYLDKDMAATKKPPEYLSGMIRQAEESLPEDTPQTALPSPRVNHGPRRVDAGAQLEARRAREAQEAQAKRAWREQVLVELAKHPDLRAEIEAQADIEVAKLAPFLRSEAQRQAAKAEHLANLAAEALGIPKWGEDTPGGENNEPTPKQTPLRANGEGERGSGDTVQSKNYSESIRGRKP